MSQDLYLAVVIALMALVTYLPRAVPLQFTTEHWPKPLIDILEFLPVAIVAAVTVAPMIVANGRFAPSPFQLAAAIPTLVCGRLTGNLMASVVVGTVSFVILQLLV